MSAQFSTTLSTAASEFGVSAQKISRLSTTMAARLSVSKQAMADLETQIEDTGNASGQLVGDLSDQRSALSLLRTELRDTESYSYSLALAQRQLADDVQNTSRKIEQLTTLSAKLEKITVVSRGVGQVGSQISGKLGSQSGEAANDQSKSFLEKLTDGINKARTIAQKAGDLLKNFNAAVKSSKAFIKDVKKLSKPLQQVKTHFQNGFKAAQKWLMPGKKGAKGKNLLNRIGSALPKMLSKFTSGKKGGKGFLSGTGKLFDTVKGFFNKPGAKKNKKGFLGNAQKLFTTVEKLLPGGSKDKKSGFWSNISKTFDSAVSLFGGSNEEAGQQEQQPQNQDQTASQSQTFTYTKLRVTIPGLQKLINCSCAPKKADKPSQPDSSGDAGSDNGSDLLDLLQHKLVDLLSGKQKKGGFLNQLSGLLKQLPNKLSGLFSKKGKSAFLTKAFSSLTQIFKGGKAGKGNVLQTALQSVTKLFKGGKGAKSTLLQTAFQGLSGLLTSPETGKKDGTTNGEAKDGEQGDDGGFLGALKNLKEFAASLNKVAKNISDITAKVAGILKNPGKALKNLIGGLLPGFKKLTDCVCGTGKRTKKRRPKKPRKQQQRKPTQESQRKQGNKPKKKEKRPQNQQERRKKPSPKPKARRGRPGYSMEVVQRYLRRKISKVASSFSTEKVKKLWGKTKDMGRGLWGKAAGAGKGIWNKVKSVAQKPLQRAKNAGKSLWSKAKGLVKNPGRSLKNAGKSLWKSGKGLLKKTPLGRLTNVLSIGSTLADASMSTGEKAAAIAKDGGVLAGAAMGAKAGAILGSVVPGVGTAIGGVVGGALGAFAGEKAVGFLTGLFSSDDEEKTKQEQQRTRREPQQTAVKTRDAVIYAAERFERGQTVQGSGATQQSAAAYNDYSTHNYQISIAQQEGEDSQVIAERVAMHIKQQHQQVRRESLHDIFDCEF